MKRSMQRGFTLIELMVVVAVVAVLAAVALPSYKDYTIRSKWASNLADIEGLKKAIKVCLNDNGGDRDQCTSLAQIQNHGYAGTQMPTPRFATGPATMGAWEDGVYINVQGNSEAGNLFMSTKTYVAADGNVKTERTGSDNLTPKVFKTVGR